MSFTGSFKAGEGRTYPTGLIAPTPAAAPDEVVSDSDEGEPIELVGELLTPEQEAEIEASGEEIPVLTDDSVPPPDAPDEGYDPSEYTVAEVTAYLDENPEQAIYVLDRERAGKARVTLIGDSA